MRFQTSISISEGAKEILEEIIKKRQEITGKKVYMSTLIEDMIKAQQITPREKIRKWCNTIAKEEMTKESRNDLIAKILENLDKI